ncbi:hypothetical protein ACGE24_04575 [Corynebacterium kroppenstedtii]|uniref:hypothetical protein n=1 Tax=Corynebacterium sp. PCR 32 TaxID=3351342 RepID=UPI003098B8E8
MPRRSKPIRRTPVLHLVDVSASAGLILDHVAVFVSIIVDGNTPSTVHRRIKVAKQPFLESTAGNDLGCDGATSLFF